MEGSPQVTHTGLPIESRRRQWLPAHVHAAMQWLPRGNTLRPAVWAHRHLLITRFALLQSVGMGVFALCTGHTLIDSAFGVAVPGIPALFALNRSLPRTLRMLSSVVSLMFASATLVDLCNGITEAHFHFFVMLGIVSLYQDWSAFGLCVLITVLHHAVMGLAYPQGVFATDSERDHPIQWAIVHGGFILAASVTHIIAWKLNEVQARRDPLTLLPNRAAFVDGLDHLLRFDDQPVSVLFVDLDNFKTINDSGGHHVGDAALSHAARAMSELLRASDVVARIGGDEFAILIPGAAANAESVAERILTALQTPFRVGGREVFVTASIGIADDQLAESRDPDDLLRDADLAMYLAKANGKNRVVTYTAGIDKDVRDQAALAQDLRVALELDQFEINYQPVFDQAGQHLCGVEALLRWHHPTRGLVPPDRFIRLAEQSGAIRAIDAWVLVQASLTVAGWQRDLPGCDELELAVNVSAAQLRDPDLLPTITSAVAHSGLPASSLILEVTETMLLSDFDTARCQLDAVRRMGAQVAIDDFGTGFSSLSYLSRLPADQVKVDRSFVRDLGASTSSRALVRGIIEMARALQLDVQAEGVETDAQQAILDELGCQRSQGYLYGRPMPAADFEAFAARTHGAGQLTDAAPLPVAAAG